VAGGGGSGGTMKGYRMGGVPCIFILIRWV